MTTLPWSNVGNTILVWNGVIPEGMAPTITSASAFSVNEGVALSAQLTANQTVTWSLVGGADRTQFAITTDGILSLPAKSFSVPTDSDLNNVYVVQVEATNASTSLNTIATIMVTVSQVIAATTGQSTGLLLALTRAS